MLALIKSLSWGTRIAIVGIILAFIAGVFTFGYMKGSARADKEIAQFETQVADLERQKAELTTQLNDRVVNVYVNNNEKIDRKNNDIQKEIASLTPQCTLSNDWVRIHNEAASGEDNSSHEVDGEAAPSETAPTD